LRPDRGLDGSEDTTAGSDLDASVWSITAMTLRLASPSMGAVNIRVASRPQLGHETVAGAVPIGQPTSMGPSRSHRYPYVAI